MYIVDMYHGIIQERQWSGPGTYLRARIEQYDLDKVVHYGRIWRLVYDGVKRGADALDRDKTVPRMNNETAAQLVSASEPSERLVARHRAAAARPQAGQVGRAGAADDREDAPPTCSARFHALWTLEGLGALDAALARQLMEDPEPRMRIQAIRASETLYKAGDRSFAADYQALTKDPSVDVVIQAMLTLNRWKVPDALRDDQGDDGGATRRAACRSSARRSSTRRRTPAAAAAASRSRPSSRPCSRAAAEVYNSLCITLPRAGRHRRAHRATRRRRWRRPLAGSPRVNGHRDYIIKAVLHGLTGPIDGRTYPQVMIPMGTNDDEWVASVASYVRQNFGNTRRVRHAGGCGAGARRDPRPDVAVGRRGARGRVAGAPGQGGLDRVGQPQRRRRRSRGVEPAVVEQRHAAAAGHVVPGRAARGRRR